MQGLKCCAHRPCPGRCVEFSVQCQAAHPGEPYSAGVLGVALTTPTSGRQQCDHPFAVGHLPRCLHRCQAPPPQTSRTCTRTRACTSTQSTRTCPPPRMHPRIHLRTHAMSAPWCTPTPPSAPLPRRAPWRLRSQLSSSSSSSSRAARTAATAGMCKWVRAERSAPPKAAAAPPPSLHREPRPQTQLSAATCRARRKRVQRRGQAGLRSCPTCAFPSSRARARWQRKVSSGTAALLLRLRAPVHTLHVCAYACVRACVHMRVCVCVYMCVRV